MENKNSQSAQSLVEVLLAITLFTLMVGGAITLIMDSYKTNLSTIEETRAHTYAREGLEAARSIRDRNYLLLINDADGTGLTTTNGYYEFSGSSNTLNNLYTRKIFVEDVYRDINGNIVASGGTLDPQTKKITSQVNWKTRQLSLTSYLANWQRLNWIRTTLTEFNQGTFNNTQASAASTPPADNGEVKLNITQSDSGFYSSADLGNHTNNNFSVGNYAYTTVDRDNKGFQVVDISNINSPTPVTFVDVGDKGLGIAVSGNYAYVTTEDADDSFTVVDISNPISPVYKTKIDIQGEGKNVAVSGNYAFVAVDEDNKGLAVVNITNPLSPTLVTTINIGDEGTDIVIEGNYAYMSVDKESAGLAIVNISNPNSPTLTTTLNVQESARGIDKNGNYLYIAVEDDPNLAIVNVSNPSSPILVSTLDISGNAESRDIAFQDNYAYLGMDDTNNGITSINVSNVNSPSLAYTLDIQGKANGAFSDPQYVFISTDTNNRGLVIIKTTQLGFTGSGDYTSSGFDSASANTKWRTISWDGGLSPGGILKFQIKTANTSANLSNATWVGSDGTSATYYQTTPSIITTHSGASGTQYIQFKAYFTGDSNSSPVLKEITFNYVP